MLRALLPPPDLILPEWDGGCIAHRNNTDWLVDQHHLSLKTSVRRAMVRDSDSKFLFVTLKQMHALIWTLILVNPTAHTNTPQPSSPSPCLSQNRLHLSHPEFVFHFIHCLLCLSVSGNQRQETVPAGSSAPSSQEDHSQTRAHRGAEAGDQGGLWTVWHGRVWIHWCQGAQGKLNRKQINKQHEWSVIMSGFAASRLHSATGRHESSGVRTEEGRDQKDDQWSRQGWHGENLLHRLPRGYDTKNGNFKVFICAHRHFCRHIKKTTLYFALPCLFLYFRLRRTQKRKSWRLSACSMTTKQARSPSRTWSAWPKSWARTSQTKSCRYASMKPARTLQFSPSLQRPHFISIPVLVKEMIDEADRDGDGEVNQQEFLRIMKKTCLYWRTRNVFPVWCCSCIDFCFQISRLWTSCCVVPLVLSQSVAVTSFIETQSECKVSPTLN